MVGLFKASSVSFFIPGGDVSYGVRCRCTNEFNSKAVFVFQLDLLCIEASYRQKVMSATSGDVNPDRNISFHSPNRHILYLKPSYGVAKLGAGI